MHCSRKNKSRGGSKPLLGTCLTHTAAASQCALKNRIAEGETLNKLGNATGGGKNRRGGENANETCPGIGVSTVAPTYISGGSDHMSPNGNETIKEAMQLGANQKAEAKYDKTIGWNNIKQSGGGPSLENFIENINSMAGGAQGNDKIFSYLHEAYPDGLKNQLMGALENEIRLKNECNEKLKRNAALHREEIRIMNAKQKKEKDREISLMKEEYRMKENAGMKKKTKKRRKKYRVDSRKKRYKHSRYLRGRTRRKKRRKRRNSRVKKRRSKRSK